MRLKISIGGKLLLFVLVLTITPLLLISFFSYLDSRKVLMNTISAENTSFALSAAKGIRNQVLSYKNVLESAASVITETKTIAEKKDILVGIKEGFPFIESVALLDKEGKEIVRSDDKPLKDKKNNPEFYIAKEKGLYVSWLKYYKVKKLSSIILAVPLLKEDKFEGVLAADIYFYEIWNQAIIPTLSPKDNCYVFTQKEQLVAKVTAQKKGWQSKELEEIASNMASGGKLLTEERATKIGPMLVIANPISVLNWELVIFRPTDEIYKPASIIKNKTIIVNILSLILVIIITVFFSRLFAKPIQKLHEGTEIIGKGNLDYKVDIRTGDEIEQLAKEFNKMVESLKKSQEALKEERASLEIRVEARTKELEELAESLEGKVKERTKELQERVDELERFHQLTVGRELKMIELKKEIKRLNEELEKYKRK